MVITITTKKFNLTDELRERIDKKLQKLDRYFHTDAEAAVRLYTQRATEVAEVTVLHNGMQFRAEGRTGEMFHSVEESVENLERQLRKHKTRLEKRLQGGAFDHLPPAGDEAPDDFTLIKQKRFQLKPMDAEEAILQMNLLGHAFFVYRDLQDEEVCVVYRRRNGGYGQIVVE